MLKYFVLLMLTANSLAQHAVYFETGSSALSDSATIILDSVAEESAGDTFFTLRGFADKTGSPRLNRALALRRLKSVRNYLINRGYPEMLLDGPCGEKDLFDPTLPDHLNRKVTVTKSQLITRKTDTGIEIMTRADNDFVISQRYLHMDRLNEVALDIIPARQSPDTCGFYIMKARRANYYWADVPHIQAHYIDLNVPVKSIIGTYERAGDNYIFLIPKLSGHIYIGFIGCGYRAPLILEIIKPDALELIGTTVSNGGMSVNGTDNLSGSYLFEVSIDTDYRELRFGGQYRDSVYLFDLRDMRVAFAGPNNLILDPNKRNIENKSAAVQPREKRKGFFEWLKRIFTKKP